MLPAQPPLRPTPHILLSVSHMVVLVDMAVKCYLLRTCGHWHQMMTETVRRSQVLNGDIESGLEGGFRRSGLPGA